VRLSRLVPAMATDPRLEPLQNELADGELDAA
jgi:hypothetical protein